MIWAVTPSSATQSEAKFKAATCPKFTVFSHFFQDARLMPNAFEKSACFCHADSLQMAFERHAQFPPALTRGGFALGDLEDQAENKPSVFGQVRHLPHRHLCKIYTNGSSGGDTLDVPLPRVDLRSSAISLMGSLCYASAAAMALKTANPNFPNIHQHSNCFFHPYRNLASCKEFLEE